MHCSLPGRVRYKHQCMPVRVQTTTPTHDPTRTPSHEPTYVPSVKPTAVPTEDPTQVNTPTTLSVVLSLSIGKNKRAAPACLGSHDQQTLHVSSSTSSHVYTWRYIGTDSKANSTDDDGTIKESRRHDCTDRCPNSNPDAVANRHANSASHAGRRSLGDVLG